MISNNKLKIQFKVGVFALPAIVFYKSHSKDPVIYAGDLYDEEAILNWLLTQKNPGGDIIEDLEGQKLKKLIEESPAIAVYFCKSLPKLINLEKFSRKFQKIESVV